jgi:RNA polymerase sigma factor (sigma-70 family)
MISFHLKPEKHPSFEEMYFSYYRQLMEWALQLTGYDRADAEDLVHDLYIQVAHSSLKLDEVEKPDAYFFSILRNLHYARLRRAGRSPIDDLSIVDFDSLEIGLASLDRRKLLSVRSTLRAVCVYVCERRHTSRTARILILRFFFGYYPSEVMKIVQMSRGAIDRSLQVAREEVRFSLERPGTIRSITPERQSTYLFTSISEDSQVLFRDLRQAIFRNCMGTCLGYEHLARRYRQESGVGFTTAELAHLVSCAKCLDDVNTILGLPLIAERSPDDTLGRDNSQGPGGAPGGPEIVPGSQSSRRKSAKASDARQKISRRMRDVFEHRPRSLQIAINGKLRTSQRVTAELSEFHLKLGRTERPAFIEVLSEQNIRLAYLHVLDPALHLGLEQTERAGLSDDRSLDVTLSYTSDVPIVHVVYRDPVAAQIRDEEQALAESAGMPATETHARNLWSPGAFSTIARWMNTARSRVHDVMPDMNPTLATALILAVASALCFLLWLNEPPRITANALLIRAEAWDAQQQKNAAPGVVNQKVRIQTPQRTLERSLYRDVQGIRIPRHQMLNDADTRLRDRLAQAGVDWNAPLSAGSYQEWHDHQHSREDEITRVSGHLLKLTTTIPSGAVMRASITVRDSDFHPIERMVELRDEGTVEIAELNYDVMPWGAVNQDWFEPLTSPRRGVASDVHPARILHLPSQLRDAELDEAELGARLALHQLDADTQERVELTRTPSSIQVTGIVATDERKHEIEAHLSLVPHVNAVLYSFQDIQSRQSAASAITNIKQSSSVERPSPLEDFLQPQSLSRNAIGELEHGLFNSSVEVNQEGKAITELLQKFPVGEQLTPNASASLRMLLASHKEKMLAALQKEESILTQANIVFARKAGNMGGSNLAVLAEANGALCGELISDSNEQPRGAQIIIPELMQSIAQLQAILSRISNDPSVSQSSSSSSNPSAPKSN